jgi:hypothetical protein
MKNIIMDLTLTLAVAMSQALDGCSAYSIPGGEKGLD